MYQLRTIVLTLLVVWTGQISSLPLKEEKGSISENERQTRQLSSGDKCCPCPVSDTSNSSDRPGDVVTLADSAGSASSLDAGAARAVDDCPCRVRDSDAAASSLFDVPGNMLGFGSFVKPKEGPKKDPKPLMYPEVGLASSVLQTLREATDEEYQEALARDAARSVSRSADDPFPEETRNIVTVFLNPHPITDSEDDVITSGTHIHESRSINPLGSTRSSSITTAPMNISRSNLLTELINRPLSEPSDARPSDLLQQDNDLLASNVQETVVESPKKESTELKIKPPLMKLMVDNKARNFLNNERNPIKASNSDQFMRESDLEEPESVSVLSKSDNNKINKKVLDLSASLLALNERISELNDVINKPLIPKIKLDDQNTPDSTQSLREHGLDADSSPAPSNIQVIASNQEKLRSTDDFVISLIKPMIPTNFFKTKDVELLPKSMDTDFLENEETKTIIPNLKLPSVEEIIARAKENTPEPLTIPSLADLLRNVLSPTKKPDNEANVPEDTFAVDPNTSRKIYDDDNEVKTKILDTVSSPSQNVEVMSYARSAENTETNSNLCKVLEDSKSSEDVGSIIDKIDDEKNSEGNISSVEEHAIEESSEITELSDDDIDQSDNINGPSNLDSIETIKTPINTRNGPAEIKLCNQVTLSGNQPEETNSLPKSQFNLKSKALQNLNKSKKSNILDNVVQPNLMTKTKPNEIHSTKIIESISNTANPDCEIRENQSSSATEFPKIGESTETSDEINDNSEVSVQDLQNMSDSLLDSSIKKGLQDDDCTVKPKTDTDSLEGESIEQEASLSSEENTKKNVDAQTEASEQVNTLNKTESCPRRLLDSKTITEDDDTNTAPMDNSNFCSQNEMAVGASSPAISTLVSKTPLNLLGSPLTQDLIIQPSSLIGGGIANIFNGQPNLFNLNPQLPSIENLRERISGLFSGVSLREKSPDFTGSPEIRTDAEDEDAESSMLSDATERRPRITLGSFDPLKEINLNLFELNPIKLNEPFKLQGLGPALNMNSLKARLQVPNLDLKPLKLQSTFGKKDGLLGATLTLGPISKNSLLARPQLLKEPLNLPSLDEMRLNLQSRAEDILHRAPQLDFNNLRNNEQLRQLDNLRENLHSNAVKHVNALQQTLSSSLDEAKVRSDSILGTTLNAQPENVFDTLSRARFDVDDRLQELHSTLADHLSSVHDMLQDSSLPEIVSPLTKKNPNLIKLKSLRPSASTNTGIARKKTITKKPINLTTSQKSDGPSNKPKGKFIISKAKSANNGPAVKPSIQRQSTLNNKNKDIKSDSNASKTRLQSTLFKPLQDRTQPTKLFGDSFRKLDTTEKTPPIRTLNVSPIKPAPALRPRPQIFRRLSKPSPESEKFKLALLTTTVSPRISASARFTTASPRLFRPRPTFLATTSKPIERQPNFPRLSNVPTWNNRQFSSPSLNKFRTNSKSLLDPSGSPSEQVLTETLPQFNILKSPGLLPQTKNRTDLLSKLKPTYKVTFSKMDLPERTGTFKPVKVLETEVTDMLGEEEPNTEAEFPIESSIPAIKEKSLLAKLTESLQSRLSGMDLKSPLEKTNHGTTQSKDMMQGASDNNLQRIVVSDDLMKEGISYQCKMLCTREN